MANLVVDRCADRFGIAAIIQWGRNGLLFVDDEIVAKLVELLCADASDHMWSDHFQYFRGQFAGNAHFFDFVGSFYYDAHQLWGFVGNDG